MSLLLLGLLAANATSGVQFESEREVTQCRMRLVTFRNETEGWALDACGGVFKTDDGGLGWHVITLAEFVADGRTIAEFYWANDSVALAVGRLHGHVLRTSDGGASWQSVRLPSKSSAPSVAQVAGSGLQVWLCDSEGQVWRTDDGGANWRGVDLSGQHCRSVVVRGPLDVTVHTYDSVSSTVDGGKHWLRRPRVGSAELFDSGAPTGHVDSARWLDEKTGWVSPEFGPVFKTVNGGKTWQSVGVAGLDVPLLRHTKTEAQGRITVWVEGPGLHEAVPVLESKSESKPVARGVHGAAVLRGELLELYEHGELIRVTPLARERALEPTELAGRGQLNSMEHWGWSRGRVLWSHDGGKTWLRVGPTPAETVDRMVFLNFHQGIAVAGAATFRTDDGGRTWKPSTSPSLDAFEMEGPKQVNPLRCLAQAPKAQLEISSHTSDCFASTDAPAVTVVFSGGTATVRQERSTRALDRTQTADLITRLTAIFERPEVLSSGGDTSSTTTTLRWSCGERPQEEVSYTTNLPPGDVTPPVVSRAVELEKVASRYQAAVRH